MTEPPTPLRTGEPPRAGVDAPVVAEPGDRPDWVARLLTTTMFLATGVALVVHVLTDHPVPLVLAGVIVLVSAVGWMWQRTRGGPWWTATRRVLVVGLGAGLVATIAYDLSRWALVWIADVPGNPYEAFPHFGRAILGQQAGATAAFTVGTAFHFVNGMAFGTAFAVAFAGRPWWWGIPFGLGLEAAMLAVYPGWLDIRALAEFTQISVLGHFCYGAVLGGLVSNRLRRPAGPAGASTTTGGQRP